MEKVDTLTFQKNSQLVRHYLKPYWVGIVSASIMTLILGVVGASVATLIGPTLKILTTSDRTKAYTFAEMLGQDIGKFVQWIVGSDSISVENMFIYTPICLVVLAAIKTSLFLWQWYSWESIGEKVSRDIRKDLVAGYLKLDPASKKQSLGQERDAELSTNVTVDVKLLREYIVRFYGGVPRELSQMLFIWVTLFFLSKFLFFVFFFGVLPSVAIVNRLGKKIRKRANNALKDYSSLTEWLQQRLSGIETIKHYRTEFLENEKMDQLTESMFQKFLGAERAKAKTAPILEFISIAAIVLVIYFSYLEISQGSLSGSVVMSFLTNLVMLSQSAAKIGKYYNSNRDGSVAVDRIKSMFDFAANHARPGVGLIFKEFKDKEVTVVCENISVLYDEKYALQDFSYQFKAGRIYCVCGKSGAGKSTLFNTILGIEKSKQGQCYINSSHINVINHKYLPVSYMPQNVLLMPGSIRQNVVYPLFDGDENKIWNSLEKAGLEKEISKLELGIDTIVGEGGKGLSGGQMQRVLLARLWYHQSPVILVDEGTSALDPENEKEIYSFLKELASLGATIIMIAHRSSAVNFSDKVLLLENGKLLVEGDVDVVKSHPKFQEVFFTSK